MRVVKAVPAAVVTETDKIDLQAALDSLAGDAPTFAEIRAALPAGKRARFTEGMIHQTALELTLKVRE